MTQREPVRVWMALIGLASFLLPWMPDVLGPWGLYTLTPAQYQSLDLVFGKVLPGATSLVLMSWVRDSVWSPASVDKLKAKYQTLIPADKQDLLTLLD